jgi:hypothetical protein
VAMHTGRVGWRQVRVAEMRDEALRVKLAVIGALSNGRVDGGGTLRKFCNGWVAGSERDEVEEDGRNPVQAGVTATTAAGLRRSSSSSSRHVGASLRRRCGLTPILQQMIRELGYRARNQHLHKYGALCADVRLRTPPPTETRARTAAPPTAPQASWEALPSTTVVLSGSGRFARRGLYAHSFVDPRSGGRRAARAGQARSCLQACL